MHRIALMAYDGIQALDLTGPHEVFAAANRAAHALGVGRRRYHLSIVAPERVSVRPESADSSRLVGAPVEVRTESGLRLLADPWSSRSPIPDTLLIPGGDAARTAGRDHPAVALAAQLGPEVERVACVCTGAFVAAAAGLLDGHRVATHWARSRGLAERYPAVEVDGDAIYLVDGKVWSSAGVTAGIDLALAMVEADLGVDVAQETARWLVVFLRRAGGQSQFAPTVWAERSPGGPIRAAQDLIDEDPAGIASVAALANAVGLSSRQFSRRFAQEVGETPGRYLERVRVAAARQQLELSNDGLPAVARRCGFGSAETLRRVFHRHLGVSPDAYRQRFATTT